MFRETYVCMCENNEIEYGFTYKEREGDEDSVSDEPIGRTSNRNTINVWLEANQK